MWTRTNHTVKNQYRPLSYNKQKEFDTYQREGELCHKKAAHQELNIKMELNWAKENLKELQDKLSEVQKQKIDADSENANIQSQLQDEKFLSLNSCKFSRNRYTSKRKITNHSQSQKTQTNSLIKSLKKRISSHRSSKNWSSRSSRAQYNSQRRTRTSQRQRTTH